MLCRTLVTAAALACTLIHAQSQDLICMLLLSGVQKDELDVSTLEKLRRHNVNIDDINETMRQQCSSTDVTEVSNIDITIDPKPTTTESYLSTETMTSHLSKDLKLSDVDTILKYYIDKQKLINSAKENMNNDERNEAHSNVGVTTAKYVQNAENMSLMSILRFWDKFKTTSTVDFTTEKVEVDMFETRPDKPTILADNTENNESRSTSDVMKILEKYFSQKDMVRSKYLKERKVSIVDNSVTVKTVSSDEIMKQTSDGTITPKIMEYKPRSKSDEEKTIEQYKQIKQESDKIIQLSETLKALIQKYPQNETNRSQPIKPKRQRLFEKELETDKALTIPKDNKDKTGQTQKTEHSEVIKEIAESIKILILNDLRREISTLIPRITSITTEMTRATKPVIQEPKQIFEHMFELFEKMKELDRSTILTPKTTGIEKRNNATIYPVTLPVFFKNPYLVKQASDSKMMADPYNLRFQNAQDIKYEGVKNYVTPIPMILGNPYSVKQILDAKVMVNPYNFLFPNSQQKIYETDHHYVSPAPISFGKPYIKKEATTAKDIADPYDFKFQYIQDKKFKTSETNIVKSKRINNKPENYMASILQTNADEIPPLAIPLERPSNLIAQTIVISTARTVNNKKSNYYNDFTKTNKSRPRSNERHSRHTERNRMNDNRSRHNLSDRYSQYKRINDINRGKSTADYIRTHSSRFQDYVKHKNTYDGQRFHEKLERVDSYVPNSWENHKKLAPRQQTPLNSIKRLHFDDAHFRNFIKTQQKVNEMLERILATKVLSESTNDGPQSVELP